MLKAAYVVLGGLLGAAAGFGLGFGGTWLVTGAGFSESGARRFALAMPFVVWLSVVLAIVGFTAAATWVAEVSAARKNRG